MTTEPEAERHLPRPRLFINRGIAVLNGHNSQVWSLQWHQDGEPMGVQIRATNRDLARRRDETIAAMVTDLIDQYLWWVEGELEADDDHHDDDDDDE